MNLPSKPQAAESLNVPIGRWGVAVAPTQIRTLLGSCVGVVLYDKVARLGGVAHIVLPDSRGSSDNLGRFADTAIPALIAEFEGKLGRSSRGRITAKLVGGASMFATGPALNIGELNLEAVGQILAKLGIAVIARDVGGDAGRRVTLDTLSGAVQIKIPGGADYEI